MDTTSIVVAAVAGVPSVTAAVFAYRSSASANRATQQANDIARAKVDAEAYERGKNLWEGMVEQARKELARQQEQINRQQEQIAELQESNDTMRRQLRELKQQTDQPPAD